MAKTNGYGGSATFAGNLYAVLDWSSNIQTEGLDTTDSESGPNRTVIGGKRSGEGTFKLQIDLASLPNIQDGDTGHLSLDYGNGTDIEIESVFIQSVSHESTAGAVLTETVSW